jgi:hypothetical protein
VASAVSCETPCAREVVEGASRDHAEVAATAERGLCDGVQCAIAAGGHDDGPPFTRFRDGTSGDNGQLPRVVDMQDFMIAPGGVQHLGDRVRGPLRVLLSGAGIQNNQECRRRRR